MTVRLTTMGDCVVMTLSRLNAMNALNLAMIEEIERALEDADKKGARALLIIGDGEKAFCGGADIKEMASSPMQQRKEFIRRGQAAFLQLERLRIPSIALINGLALGGGLELALACTFRLASPAARFGLPEVKLGLIPGFGGTQRLPRVVGHTAALDMILSGRILDAKEAVDLGLLHSIVSENLLDAGCAMARRFSGYSQKALGFARQAVHAASDLPIEEGLRLEAELIAEAFASHDGMEGIAAFVEKRQPRFTDS